MNTIIVDSSPDGRMNLKQATSSVPHFQSVLLSANLGDSLRQMSEPGANWDLVFVSGRFENSSIATFISEGKQTRGGQDAAYILVVSANAQSTVKVAENLITGADGFLCSPFSVNSLVEIAQVASIVKCQRIRERQEAALKIIVADAIRHIDRVALSLYMGHPPGDSIRDLKEIGATISSLSEDWHSAYFTQLIAETGKISAPVLPEIPKSKRVLDRLKKQREEVVVNRTSMARIIKG